MAADELIDYLDNGNIRNSVNMPCVCMERSGVARVCIIHKNIPNMLNHIISLVSADGANIENMTNKSRGEYAYTMLDLGAAVPEKLKEDLKALDDVIFVRVI